MEKYPRIKIFVAHHKPWYVYEDDVYVPIQVWKKKLAIDLWIIWDDTWDNISEKNANYAELTAQYWVWKNYDLRDVDYVWFCHYRRYMTYCYEPNIFNYIFAKNFYSPFENVSHLFWKWIALKENHCLMKYNQNKLKNNSEWVKEYIQNTKYDLYMPKKVLYLKWKILSKIWKKCPPPMNFCWFSEENKLFIESINLFYEKYPEQVRILKILENQWSEYFWRGRHMFIMRKNLYLQYMERLFGYLFELEKLIEEKHLDITMHWAGKYDWRFMWIFSESLINYWIERMRKRESIKVSSDANTLMFTDYYL